jgi:hypothetical protein
VLHIPIAFISIVLLLTIVWWVSYCQQVRARSRRVTVVDSNSHRRFYKRTVRDPEEQYIEGVGYVIGDLSCHYNARSPYIRCAVNPDGLCQDCRHYSGEQKN